MDNLKVRKPFEMLILAVVFGLVLMSLGWVWGSILALFVAGLAIILTINPRPKWFKWRDIEL